MKKHKILNLKIRISLLEKMETEVSGSLIGSVFDKIGYRLENQLLFNLRYELTKRIKKYAT